MAAAVAASSARRCLLSTAATAAPAATAVATATTPKKAHHQQPPLQRVALPDGTSLECLDVPAAAGTPAHTPPIVLMHEALGCVAWFKDLPEVLAAATGARVFAYSRHGHGHSSPYRTAHTPRYMHVEAQEVLPAVLAARGPHRPPLGGPPDGAPL